MASENTKLQIVLAKERQPIQECLLGEDHARKSKDWVGSLLSGIKIVILLDMNCHLLSSVWPPSVFTSHFVISF